MTYREKFNIAQRNEIRSGLESGIDISIYAKPEFSWGQMRHASCRVLLTVTFAEKISVPVEVAASPVVMLTVLLLCIS